MIELDAEFDVADVPALDEDDWEFITDEFLDDSEEMLARQGARLVHDFADSHIRLNRNRYLPRIRAEVNGSRWSVTDQRSNYGPWLAGSSKRNRRNQFKGYPHWDEARAELNRDKVQIVAPKLRGYIPKLRRSK
ncbi:MAG: hypothetical protein V4515_04575 [Chloroflexota bacterium]